MANSSLTYGPAALGLNLPLGNLGDQLKQQLFATEEEQKKKNAGSRSMIGSAAAGLGLPY